MNNNWGYQRPLKLLRLENGKLKDQIRQLSQRNMQINGGAGSGGGGVTYAVGKASGVISASTSTNPGTGTVVILDSTTGTYVDTGMTKSVKNAGAQISDGKRVSLHMDQFYVWWATPEECE